MMHEFSLETLVELDGSRICEAWNQAVQRVARDCEDRPAEKKARKVVLELELVPVFDHEGHVLDSCNGTFKVKDNVPVRQSKEYNFGFRKAAGQPQLIFNDMADDNIHQRSIDEMIDE